MKTSKVLAFVLALLLCVSVFAGCASQQANTEPTAEPTAEKPAENPEETEETPTGVQEPANKVEIEFWHIFPEGDDTFNYYEELVNNFNSKYENITVKHMGISFWDYWTKISTSVAGGEGPDVGFYTTSDAKRRIDEGILVNLSDYFKKDEMSLDGYIQSQFMYMQDDKGDLFAFPYGTPARVLYYNKDMFAEAGLDPETPPTNWEELEAYADKLTKFKDGNKEMIDVMGFDPVMGNFLFWTLAWTNGGDFFDDDLNPTINSAKNVEALEYMVRLHTKYGKGAMQAFNSQASALQIDPFAAGKAAMEVHNEGLYAIIKQNAPDLNFGVAPIPYQGDNRANWSSGFTLEIFEKGDQDKRDAAWLFFKELISTENQVGFYERTGWLMSDKALFELDSVKNDPVMKTLIEESEYAKNIEYVEADTAWHVTITPFIEAALLLEKTPQEALDEAQAAVEKKIAAFNEQN